jgi:SAM-dependent methyltransferase
MDHDAVQRSYDAVAASYAERFDAELEHKPLDRALLATVVEEADAAAPIADLGCGPGHVAAWLAGHGARAVGIDLSPAMVAAARERHREVEFRQGDLLALPADDGEFGALVAFYCLIHLAEDEVALAATEMRRVLRPGGLALVSFHVGTEVRHFDEFLGARVDLDFRFLEVAAVTAALTAAGFELRATLERANYPEEVETRRAYLLGRRR